MILEFQAFIQAFQKGKELTNSATWKNRTTAVNSLVAVLGSAAFIAKGFGYDLHLDNQTLQDIGGGVFAFYGLYNAVVTTVTSAKVGMPTSTTAP